MARRRSNGEGSLFQTKSGLWRGAAVFTDPQSGAVRRKYVSAMSQNVARERLTALRRDLDIGRMPPSSTPSVTEYLDDWLVALRSRVRPSTWRSHELAVRLHIKPHVGTVRVNRLSPTDVERLTFRLTVAGHAPMARNVRMTLRLALQDAVRDGLVARNVAALARAPRVDRNEMSILTGEQVRTLLDATKDDDHGAVIAILVLTGMRCGEALGLLWSDFDANVKTLKVQRSLTRDWQGAYRLADTKTSRSRRTLPLPNDAVAVLRRRRARQNEQRLTAGSAWSDNDLIFTDAVGRPLRQWTVGGALTRSLKRAALPHVRVHDLRHTAASMMLAQGVPLRTVSEHLGHSGLAITADLYTHLGESQRREAADALQRAVSGGTSGVYP